MQATMQVRWKTERPGCGYQVLSSEAVLEGPHADNLVLRASWNPTTLEAIWNPTGGKAWAKNQLTHNLKRCISRG